MKRVTIAEAARAAIIDHGVAATPFVACGLLLGYRQGTQATIVRALRCINDAPSDRRDREFVIDAEAIRNVRRSLEKSNLSILGIYSAGADVPDRFDSEDPGGTTEMLWLDASSPEGLRVGLVERFGDARFPPEEIDLEVVEPQAARLARCPD